MLLITCFIFGLLGSFTRAVCPDGWTVCLSGTFAYKDGRQWNCYKFYEDRLTFEEAEQECQNKSKGHLASFNSDKEAKLIGAYVTEENMEKDFVWIGLQRDEGSSMSTGWRWVDGSQSRYRNWRTREPNGYDEYCVGLRPLSEHVKWVDLRCINKLPFLCKWTPA
uniref:C-type lectin 3 n=1 Tax=Hypsiglena sp. JMG-2014 TaxID=1550645 RepID=A0A098M247_9SAUR